MNDFPEGWPFVGASPALVEALRTAEHAVVVLQVTPAGLQVMPTDTGGLWRAQCVRCPWQTEADAPKALVDAAARLHTTPEV